MYFGFPFLFYGVFHGLNEYQRCDFRVHQGGGYDRPAPWLFFHVLSGSYRHACTFSIIILPLILPFRITSFNGRCTKQNILLRPGSGRYSFSLCVLHLSHLCIYCYTNCLYFFSISYRLFISKESLFMREVLRFLRGHCTDLLHHRQNQYCHSR